MKALSFLALVMFSLSTGSCCLIEHRTEPAYPKSISGWKERDEQGVRIRGDFVLKKGETTDNGKVQVKVIGLIPPNPCAETGTFSRQARARIQFARLSDNKVLFDDIFAENGTMTLSTVKDAKLYEETDKDAKLYEEFGIHVIYIYDINLTDGWVHFELRG
jgi:hypothetical protein